jgi:thiamine biosynthesis protein ThiI
LNKEEIIEQSKLVGTHELASQVQEHCAMVSRGPATAAKLKDIERQEGYLEKSQVSDLLVELIAQRSIFDLRSLDLSAQAMPELATQEIPEKAMVIDLRSKAAHTGWHFGESLHLEFNQALSAYPSFDPDQTYVFYCEYEIKSAQLAELLSKQGTRASYFKGGLKGLVAYAKAKGLPTPEFVTG